MKKNRVEEVNTCLEREMKSEHAQRFEMVEFVDYLNACRNGIAL